VSGSRIVSFPNRAGLLLRGILHEPDPSVARGVCVLLLSPGIKGRVGPHRLYLKIAARLVPLGFHVLRFDYYGLGDSEGEISERALADMYVTIQGGRYIDDTIAAMDWAQQNLRISRFVGSGLCGGSLSALLTAERDSRIECLLGIGIPAILDGGPANWERFLTRGQLANLRSSYLRKLLDPHSWQRLLSGKTNYSMLWRSLKKKTSPEPRSGSPEKDGLPPDNANPRFAQAFRTLIESRRPMLLIFSGNDRLHFEFEEKFEARHADLAAQRGRLYDTFVIPQANHVLSDCASMQAMLDRAEQWLNNRYGPSLRG
jgi:pimeloyl-ACP methyl ester carboxylesterase